MLGKYTPVHLLQAITNNLEGYVPDSSFCSAAHYTVRRTADFAFMLRDYHSAMIFYDAIRQDYLDDTALISMPNVVVCPCLLEYTLMLLIHLSLAFDWSGDAQP
jgi:hypothetical protein